MFVYAGMESEYFATTDNSTNYLECIMNQLNQKYIPCNTENLLESISTFRSGKTAGVNSEAGQHGQHGR